MKNSLQKMLFVAIVLASTFVSIESKACTVNVQAAANTFSLGDCAGKIVFVHKFTQVANNGATFVAYEADGKTFWKIIYQPGTNDSIG